LLFVILGRDKEAVDRVAFSLRASQCQVSGGM
jgi:hypothetical protein